MVLELGSGGLGSGGLGEGRVRVRGSGLGSGGLGVRRVRVRWFYLETICKNMKSNLFVKTQQTVCDLELLSCVLIGQESCQSPDTHDVSVA